MDGENNGSKPYFLMDDLGGKNHPYFWFNTHIGKTSSTIWQYKDPYEPTRIQWNVNKVLIHQKFFMGPQSQRTLPRKLRSIPRVFSGSVKRGSDRWRPPNFALQVFVAASIGSRRCSWPGRENPGVPMGRIFREQINGCFFVNGMGC